MAAPRCEGSGDDLHCPALSTTESDALWTYLEAIEDYAHRAWRECRARGARAQVVAP